MSAECTQSNAKTLQDELICPVLLEPLSEAVSLVPCAHKVQQAAAETMFGATRGGWQVRPGNLCPVCRESVLGYMKDHSTRNIVKQLFALPESEINAMLALMKKNLAEKSMSVKKDILVEMPYPGKSARFIHSCGDWGLFEPAPDLCRMMEFKSSTEDSLLEKFSVVGYKNGDVSIAMYFSKPNKDVIAYLKQFDLIADSFDLAHAYVSHGKDQLKIFFNILANNNAIPDSHFEMIRDLVAKGTHTS